jgi:hypothetical protein
MNLDSELTVRGLTVHAVDVPMHRPLKTGGGEVGHAGVLLVPSSVGNEAFGVLISSVEDTLADTGQEEWVYRVAWLRRP